MGIRFKRNMATGLLVLVPMAAAAWILYFSFMWVDRLLWDRLRFSFVREGGIPGVGFVIVMIVVYLTGLVSNNYLGGRVVRWWEKQLLKIPLFGKIYGPTRQVSQAFFSADRKRLFRSVGLVEYLARNGYAVVFEVNSVPTSMAARLAGAPLAEDTVAVFVPTSPNPATGFVIVVPRHDYRVLPISIEDGLKIVVSCGVFMPHDAVVPVSDLSPDIETGERRGA